MCLVLFQKYSTPFYDEDREGVTPLVPLYWDTYYQGNVKYTWIKCIQNR